MFGNLGLWEWVIIIILVIIIFGGRKLPELGRGLGQGLANFRRAIQRPDPSPTPPPAEDSPPPDAVAATASEAKTATDDATANPPAGEPPKDK